MSFNADPPRTQELIGAAREVIERAKNEPISEEDLQKVKETQRQSRVKALKQNRFWHGGMTQNVLNDDALSRADNGLSGRSFTKTDDTRHPGCS